MLNSLTPTFPTPPFFVRWEAANVGLHEWPQNMKDRVQRGAPHAYTQGTGHLQRIQIYFIDLLLVLFSALWM